MPLTDEGPILCAQRSPPEAALPAKNAPQDMIANIRPYTAQDRAACQAVFYHAVRVGTAARYTQAQREAWAPSPTPPATPDRLLTQWCFVAADTEGLTGFMSMTNTGHLDMAFVLPRVMGTGVAGALYQALMPQAAGLQRLTTHASHLARPFFTRRGWQVVEAQDHPHNGQIFERFAMAWTAP